MNNTIQSNLPSEIEKIKLEEHSIISQKIKRIIKPVVNIIIITGACYSIYYFVDSTLLNIDNNISFFMKIILLMVALIKNIYVTISIAFIFNYLVKFVKYLYKILT